MSDVKFVPWTFFLFLCGRNSMDFFWAWTFYFYFYLVQEALRFYVSILSLASKKPITIQVNLLSCFHFTFILHILSKNRKALAPIVHLMCLIMTMKSSKNKFNVSSLDVHIFMVKSKSYNSYMEPC